MPLAMAARAASSSGAGATPSLQLSAISARIWTCSSESLGRLVVIFAMASALVMPHDSTNRLVPTRVSGDVQQKRVSMRVHRRYTADAYSALRRGRRPRHPPGEGGAGGEHGGGQQEGRARQVPARVGADR